MKLKICGVRTNEMVRACHGGQVDYIGLNFVQDSKRRVLRIPDLGSGHRFKIVGIFQDQSLPFIVRMATEASLDIIQLHGEESPEFVDELTAKLPEINVWKALSADDSAVSEKVPQYCKKCDLILFDSKNPGSGNKILDLKNLLELIKLTKVTGTKVGIAGGINADNIAQYRQKFPEAWLLDTASGVELRGDFSADELKRLVTNFHQ